MELKETPPLENLRCIKCRMFLLPSILQRILTSQKAIVGESVANLVLWSYLKKNAEDIVTDLAKVYDVKAWTPDTYLENYVDKFLRELDGKLEVVERAPKKIVFCHHHCFLSHLDMPPELGCEFCEIFESLVAEITLKGKATIRKTLAKGSPHCEVEVVF